MAVRIFDDLMCLAQWTQGPTITFPPFYYHFLAPSVSPHHSHPSKIDVSEVVTQEDAEDFFGSVDPKLQTGALGVTSSLRAPAKNACI